MCVAVATSTCQSNALVRLQKKRIWWKWWERQRQRGTGIRPIWPLYGWSHRILLPWRVGGFFVHLDQWEANEEGIETERDIGEQKLRKRRGHHERNLEQPPVGRRPHYTTCKEEAEWGFLCECIQRVWAKDGSWNNVVTTGLFIRLFIDVCWHWRAASTVVPRLPLSTLFDFISQSLS